MIETAMNLAMRNPFSRTSRALFKAFPGPAFTAAHVWPDLVTAGEGRLPLVLSFDCDTEEDAEAVPGLLRQLDDRGLPAAFAVIGQLVEHSPEAYRAVAASGHEVVNHGYNRHTRKRTDGEYESCRFYPQLSRGEINADIEDNHACIQSVLGVTPSGFRTPHFSTFQRPDDRDFIYACLSALGYAYSTSVTSIHLKAARTAPLSNAIREFPITGCWGDLRSPFDSWGLIASPGRRYVDADFHRLFGLMLRTALASERKPFLNFYFDPAHVAGFGGFESMLDDIAALRDRLLPLTYGELLARVEETHAPEAHLCAAS